MSALIFLFSFFIIYLLRKFIQRYLHDKRLPDGPYGLPLVGYLPFFAHKPYLKFIQLSKKYGNIFSVGFGDRSVVILNDFQSIKDAFTQDASLGRPANTFVNVILPGFKAFIEESGQKWKEQRRFALHTLRELGYGKHIMENNIKDEISNLLKAIDTHNGEKFNLDEIIGPSVSNNVFYILYGYRLDYNDKRKKCLDKAVTALSEFYSILGTNGFLKYILKIYYHLSPLTRCNLKGMVNDYKNLIQESVNEKIKNFDSSKPIECYIDGYLAEMKERERKGEPIGSFEFDRLNGNVRGFFGAGSETTRTTLNWIFKMLTSYPQWQKAIQHELDEVVGRDRLPSWRDYSQLPLTQAVIMEIQRFASVLPLNLPRRAMEDMIICGKKIPKDTEIIANLYGSNYDEKFFQNPNEFNPNRFLDADQKTLKSCEALLAFSLGKRACVGEIMAKFEVFFYTTILCQKYNIETFDDEKKFNFETSLGISLQLKHLPLLSFNQRIRKTLA